MIHIGYLLRNYNKYQQQVGRNNIINNIKWLGLLGGFIKKLPATSRCVLGACRTNVVRIPPRPILKSLSSVRFVLSTLLFPEISMYDDQEYVFHLFPDLNKPITGGNTEVR